MRTVCPHGHFLRTTPARAVAERASVWLSQQAYRQSVEYSPNAARIWSAAAERSDDAAFGGRGAPRHAIAPTRAVEAASCRFGVRLRSGKMPLLLLARRAPPA